MTDTGNRTFTGHVMECRDGEETPDVVVTNIDATGTVCEGRIHSELGTLTSKFLEYYLYSIYIYINTYNYNVIS